MPEDKKSESSTSSQITHVSPFDAIRHTDEEHGEHWSARELCKILGYTEWRNFNNTVIKRAMKACEENGRAISDHFVQSYKAIIGGKGAKQEVKDVLLSRYAPYLVVMNGDPRCQSSQWDKNISPNRHGVRRSTMSFQSFQKINLGCFDAHK